MPGGSFGNGGAMRIAPLGLALHNAPLEQLQQGVRAALLCTHVHPVGVEGALTMAAAVAQASQMDPAAGDGGGGGVALLQLLQERLAGAISPEMAPKLDLLCHAALEQLPGFKPPDRNWVQHLASPAWAVELSTAAQVAPGFQIRATDAVAAALWAAVCHWTCPADAVVAAVHYGGDTDTLACMTGALMGALHGSSWIPSAWLLQLENGSSPPAEPGQPASFFDEARLARVLEAGDLAASAERCNDVDDGGPEALVLTTRDMYGMRLCWRSCWHSLGVLSHSRVFAANC